MIVIRLGGYFLQGDNGWGPLGDATLFDKKAAPRMLKDLQRYYPNAVAEETDRQPTTPVAAADRTWRTMGSRTCSCDSCALLAAWPGSAVAGAE